MAAFKFVEIYNLLNKITGGLSKCMKLFNSIWKGLLICVSDSSFDDHIESLSRSFLEESENILLKLDGTHELTEDSEPSHNIN